MKKLTYMIVLILICQALAGPAAAQTEPELKLNLSRNFGFSSGTGKIQGDFSAKASGPDDLARVVFYIDDQVLGEVNQAPFNLRFNTDDYPQGLHTLYARGYTSAGRELRSNEVQAEFVSAEEGWQSAMQIMTPLLLILGVVLVASVAVTLIGKRKYEHLPLGAPRNYGAAGGAICPRCQRPYPRNFLSPNMLVGKLERCPFCGKWAIVPAVPLETLRAAEQAELKDAQVEAREESEEDRLRKDLDASRYQDL